MEDGHPWLALSGELDMATAPRIYVEVDAALAAKPEQLTMDLSRLTFLDSAGLRVMLATHKKCAAQDCRLLLVKGPPAVHRPFEIAGLDKLFEFAP